MTMQRPQLVPDDAVQASPKREKTQSRLRDGGVGVISALLGAGLALGVGIIQDNRRLSPHAPTVGVTAVGVFTPEIATPDPNKAMPPAIIDKQITTLHDRLGVSDEEISIPSEKATALIDANIAAAASLEMLDSPLRFIRVDTWVEDMSRAAKLTIALYSQKALIESLRAVFDDKSLSVDQAKAAFLKILESHPDHDDAIAELAVAYQMYPDNDTIKQIEKKLPTLSRMPVVWTPMSWPEGDLHLLSQGFSIGRIGIALRHKNNLGRAAANSRLALMISRFDREDLGQVAGLAVGMLLSEIEKLGTFLAASDKLIKDQVRPRVSIESSAFNNSRAAVTIAPRGVLRITASGGARFDIRVTMAPPDTKETDHKFAAADPGGLRYATIESGKLARIIWIGDFKGTDAEWSSLAKAYESGTLDCELTIETVDGLAARSAAAPFGSTPVANDKDVVALAEAKL